MSTDLAWPVYENALLEPGPPAYPRCTRGALTVVCKRTLAGDLFVVEVEARGLDAREVVARFRATSF